MDKSEHKRNELVIKGTRIGVWDWNVQTGEAYFSERYAEIIGLTLEEFGEASFEAWAKRTHPEDVKKAKKMLKKHFDGETEYYDTEARMRHKDGHWVWVRTRGKVFEWDNEGKPLRMSGSHSDISKHKKLEFDLKNALKERDILLKEVHHRVKNNLQILLSLSHLKSKEGMIETREIEASINSIARAYEAIYKSKQVHQIILGEHIENIVRSMIAGHEIDFALKADPYSTDIDFIIPIGLIITELVNNSIKYAKPKSEHLKITIDLKSKNGLFAIRYSDNGAGYDDHVLKNLSESKTFGITIIQSLAKQLDGSIELYNQDGAAAKIEIELEAEDKPIE